MKRLFFSFLLIFLVANLFGFWWNNTNKNLPKKEALFYQKGPNNTVKCDLCPRKCILKEGERGFCGVRINYKGTLYTLGYDNPVAVAIDPIEKKPFFHVLPGAQTLSIAVAGCNMRCKFCQNWQISQAQPDKVNSYHYTPQQIVEMAQKYKCPYIVYTYTEPTVFYEYMLEIAKLAHQKGIRNGVHTCGYINPEPLKKLLPYLDAVNVDLKGFSEDFYQKMGVWSNLSPVLKTIKMVKEAGVWLEITNLVIPGQNDDPKMVKKMCQWIVKNLGTDVPVHFSRFMPAFKLMNVPPTPVETLKKCYQIAKDAGIKFVYIGNVFGNSAESTYCPKCGKILIKRKGYLVLENNIVDGKCKFCGEKIPGQWK